MAKHHSSFNRAMVLIFIVIGISTWVFSNIDLPQKELTGLAGGGFFEVFDRDLAGMALTQSEAVAYLVQKRNEVETYSAAALTAQANAITFQTNAESFPVGDPSRQSNLALAEAQVIAAEQYTSLSAAIAGEVTSKQSEILGSGLDPNIYTSAFTQISMHYSTTLTVSTTARSSYDTTVETLTPTAPETPDEPVVTPPPPTAPPVVTTTGTLTTDSGDHTLDPTTSYEAIQVQVSYNDGTKGTGYYIFEDNGDGTVDVFWKGSSSELTVINTNIAPGDIQSVLQDGLEEWTYSDTSPVYQQIFTEVTITGDGTTTVTGTPTTVYDRGAEVASTIDPFSTSLATTFGSSGVTSASTGTDSPYLPPSALPSPSELTEGSVGTDTAGFVYPTTTEGIAGIGAIMDDAERIFAGKERSISSKWDPSTRTFSYQTTYAKDNNYRMNYYIDDYGHLYRTFGTGDDEQIQLITEDIDGGIYDHEMELMYVIQQKAENGQNLESEGFLKHTFDGDCDGCSPRHITSYLDRQDQQAEYMKEGGTGTTIKKSDIDKIYASVLALTQEIDGLSSGDVMLLKKAGMDDTAIRDAYNQIPPQYRGGAAEELSKEVRAINNHLADTGKGEWTYNGGVAYSGSIGGTSVGRSADGDVWIEIPGSDDKAPTKLYREGGGIVPKFYTLRTDGSKVYKDKGTVPKAEREALAEANSEIKKISTSVEADRRAGKIIDPESEEALSRAGYVQRAKMEVEYKKIEAYNQARFVGLLNSVFDKKLGAWSNGVPSKICAKVFGLDYYKQDGWTRVPENSSAYQIQAELLKNIRTVMIEGEKEEVFEGIYRYAYTVRLLTNSTVQWETYLKNSCTQELSIEVFYDYGLLYQGQHFLYHYAGSQTQDMIFEQGIDPVYLFDTACVQFDDELEPYCVSLIHGNGFATPEKGKDYGCTDYELEDHNVQGTDDLYVYE
jgi:hypothetical protein